MVYIRSKKIKNKEYFYLVKGKRNKQGIMKQKVLLYIGDKNKLLKFHKDMKKCLENSKKILPKNLE